MFPIIRFGSRLGALATVWVVLSSTAMATPTTVNVDEFQVILNQSVIFDDSFNSNTTLQNSGPLQPASVTFSNGATADYFVHGTIPQTTANNGQATLNTANGIIQSQPPPFIGTISTNGAFLQTGTSSTGVHTLQPSSSFDVEGLFNFVVPTTPLGTYNIVLTNRITANGFMGNVLELRIRNCVAGQGLCAALSGPVMQFVWEDRVNNTEALIAQFKLTPTELAAPQVVLDLTNALSGGGLVTAAYAFGSFSSLPNSFTVLGTAGPTTDVFTAANQFVLPGFEAFDPVPEPPSLLLLFSGLLGLAGLAGWRRHEAAVNAFKA
jgi:hypothetical protein